MTSHLALPVGGVPPDRRRRSTTSSSELAALPAGRAQQRRRASSPRAPTSSSRARSSLRAVLEVGGFDALEATEAGLREGVLFERLLARRRAAAVRRRAPRDRAEPRRAVPRRTTRTSSTSRGWRSACSTSSPRRACTPATRPSASCCGPRHAARHRDDGRLRRPPQALALPVLNAGLPGFDPREVALIGQAVALPPQGHARRSGRCRAARRGRRRRGWTACALLLRLAEDLERSRDQAVHAVGVEVGDGTVRLALEADERRRASRAGPPPARASSSPAPSGASWRSRPSAPAAVGSSSRDGPTGMTIGCVAGCSRETASATSSSNPKAEPSQSIRTRFVGTRSSARTGRPHSSSHPSRSWSTGLSRIEFAGTGQSALCWSRAALIAARFFASNWLTRPSVAPAGRPT